MGYGGEKNDNAHLPLNANAFIGNTSDEITTIQCSFILVPKLTHVTLRQQNPRNQDIEHHCDKPCGPWDETLPSTHGLAAGNGMRGVARMRASRK